MRNSYLEGLELVSISIEDAEGDLLGRDQPSKRTRGAVAAGASPRASAQQHAALASPTPRESPRVAARVASNK